MSTKTLKRGGCQPKYHRMDNECTQLVKDNFNQEEINYQLAPPGEHRTNAAERAIRTAKNNLKAGWWAHGQGLPHAPVGPNNSTSRDLSQPPPGLPHQPRLSAHEQLHGRFDFNATPLAPQESKYSLMPEQANEPLGKPMPLKPGM